LSIDRVQGGEEIKTAPTGFAVGTENRLYFKIFCMKPIGFDTDFWMDFSLSYVVFKFFAHMIFRNHAALFTEHIFGSRKGCGKNTKHAFGIFYLAVNHSYHLLSRILPYIHANGNRICAKKWLFFFSLHYIIDLVWITLGFNMTGQERMTDRDNSIDGNCGTDCVALCILYPRCSAGGRQRDAARPCSAQSVGSVFSV